MLCTHVCHCDEPCSLDSTLEDSGSFEDDGAGDGASTGSGPGVGTDTEAMMRQVMGAALADAGFSDGAHDEVSDAASGASVDEQSDSGILDWNLTVEDGARRSDYGCLLPCMGLCSPLLLPSC